MDSMYLMEFRNPCVGPTERAEIRQKCNQPVPSEMARSGLRPGGISSQTRGREGSEVQPALVPLIPVFLMKDFLSDAKICSSALTFSRR